MTMDAGSIKYTVEAETSDLLKAERVVDKSTSAIASDFKKIDNAAKKTEMQISKTSSGVKKGMAGMGRGAGQAGIQFQQFIGQVQGGQDVMLAFSQQSADLGIVLGAPLLGAIMGIAASVGGIFIASLNNGIKKTEEFKFEVKDLTKELKMLEGLTRAQSKVAITELGKSMDSLSKEAEKSGKKIAKLNGDLDRNGRLLRGGRKLVTLSAKARKNHVEELNKEQANLDAINKKYKIQSDALVELTTKQKGIVDGTRKQKEEIDSLKISLEGQIVALRDGEKASFEYATAQTLGLKSIEKIPDAIQAQIDKVFELRAAQKQTATDKRAQDVADSKKKTASTSASSFAGGIVSRGMSEADRFAAEGEKLKELRVQGLITDKEYEAARTAIHNEESTKRAAQEASAQAMMQTAIVGFLSSTTSALLAGMDEQSGAYKAMFVIQKSLAIASILMNAHTASIAALSPVGGLGPVAGIGLSNTILGLGYASAGIVAGTAIAGGREHGGGVSKGNAYRMGEAGPEILTQGGKNYVIPGENGTVTPNSKIGGGVSIVINNNAPGVDVQANTSNDGKTIEIAVKRAVNEVANQISNNQGVVPRALRQSTNTTMRANR